MRDTVAGAGMRWLYEQMRKLPWHTSLHLLPLYDAYDHNLLPLVCHSLAAILKLRYIVS